MKKILFILVCLITTVTTYSQRTFEVSLPEQMHSYNVLPDTSFSELHTIGFIEMECDYTEVRISDMVNTVSYIINIRYTTMLDIFINTQYCLYKSGYISRKQFCKYRREYNKAHSSY